jgi:Tfp pilus assembly protein PilZ
MAHLTYQASVRTGLSDIAEEFRELDAIRRHQGLSMTEAERYHSLFARLSDALASAERHRRVDARQFLRVQFDMALVLRTPEGEVLATCQDFGGGGCAITASEVFHLNDDVWIDGAIIEGVRHPLHGRAVVVWARLANSSAPQGYGLRFAIDSREMRDQVDRVMYRVLDAFLHAPPAREITTPAHAQLHH